MADGSKVGNAYVEVTPKAANNFSSVLERELEGLSEGSGDAKGSLFGAAFSGGMTGAIGAGAVMVGSILADMVETGAQLAMDMVGDAFNGFADFQQLEGGMKKLFGEEAAQTVIDNANMAFQTAGMSANEYMEKTTSIAASLVSSCGGDTQEAARLADVAIKAMSDNYNTFGTDAESVSNAIMGLAKQNYTMLDNLSLGYAGTQQGMLQLINDSGVLGYTLTDTAQLADVGFATMVEAIQAVQEQQGIAGTTFDEYKTTVRGSIDALEASWQNWLAALGNPDANMGEMTDQLLESLEVAGENVLPLVERIVNAMSSALPGLIESVGPVVIPAVTNMVASIAPAVVSMAPTLLTAGMQLFLGLVQAAVVMLPVLGQTIVASAPMMIASGMEFFNGLGYALGQVGGMLADALIYLVTHLPQIILEGTVYMIEAGANLFTGFIEGLLGMEPESTRAGTTMADAAVSGAMEGSDASAVGENITNTLLASLDAGTVGAEASEGAAEGVDVGAMSGPTMEMVEQAIADASSVDASSIGASLSASAASGVDMGALSSSMAQLNTSTTVSIAADTSGADAIAAAAGMVESSYGSMASAVESSMAAAADSAARAAASVRRAIDIPNKTVSVNVSRGYTVLPHFSMSGTFDAKTGSVPTVNVSWWDKGGLFTQPAIIGVGEGREPEGVFPLSKLEDLMNIEPRGGGGDTYIIEKVEYLPDSEMARYARGMVAEARRLGRM